MTDLLLLAMGRLPGGGVTVAGMTTEPNPITGLRWVRPIASTPLTLDDLRAADGTFAQPCDVLAVELGQPVSAPPHIENVEWITGLRPIHVIRQLSGARRTAFLAKHVDPTPEAVIVQQTRERSLCLVRPDEIQAVFSLDEETGIYEARLVVKIGRLRARDGVVVTDVYWRAWGRQWLTDDPFVELAGEALRQQLGTIYLVLGVNSKGMPAILGVHPEIPFEVALDPSDL